jgi:molecular chaperone GrpE
MTDKPHEQAETQPGTAEAAPAETVRAEESAHAELAAELAAVKEQLLRTLADMENLRKRTQREIDDTKRYAVTSFARDLLEVADNLRRAAATIPDDVRTGEGWASNLATGIDMTERTLLASFAKNRIERISPECGEKFDHQRHEAVFEVPTEAFAPGTVAQVMADGYVIADRLLRPAMVGVAKAPTGAPPPRVNETA